MTAPYHSRCLEYIIPLSLLKKASNLDTQQARDCLRGRTEFTDVRLRKP